MAATRQCLASLARLSLLPVSRPAAAAAAAAAASSLSIPRFLAPTIATTQTRSASTPARKDKKKKKKKLPKTFKSYDLSKAEQYSLCDAIRYLRAFEVGRPPSSVKYSVAIKFKTIRTGPTVRNRIRLPHPVKTDTRVAVVCPEDSPVASEARQAGAVAVGEESLFAIVRAGKLPFNRLLCHASSEAALAKANLGRLLGPKGLMPSRKTRTVVTNVRQAMRDLVGADEYRERAGALRLAVGQLGFTPEMLADNVKAFLRQVKDDVAALEDEVEKKIEEVVLSTTNGPGFSLNGTFPPTDDKIQPAHLAGPM